jgi:branched-chain amino acid transport system ATP-binding protein
MLAIGRALVTGPDLMILDEPSEGLAPAIIERLEAVLKEAKASGTPILLVEQNYHLATRLADYVCVLSQRLVQLVGKVALSVKQPVKIRRQAGCRASVKRSGAK